MSTAYNRHGPVPMRRAASGGHPEKVTNRRARRERNARKAARRQPVRFTPAEPWDGYRTRTLWRGHTRELRRAPDYVRDSARIIAKVRIAARK